MQFGLMGCGEVGRARAEALRKTPGATLAVVADVVKERAQWFARHYGCEAAFSVQELVHYRHLDAVIVSTPPDVHAAQGLAALAAGKHVLVEKPLAPSVAEGQQLVEAARAGGLTLATGFNYRYYVAVQKARALIDQGRIGRLDHVRAFAGHPGGEEFTRPWVHDVNVMGGGALMDNGIHLVDLTRYFLGEVVEAAGYRTGAVWRFAGCEDNGFALLRNAEGNVATLQVSWTEWRGYRYRVEIYGSEGCVVVSYPPMLAQWFGRKHDGPAGRRRVYFFPLFQFKERLFSPTYTLVQSFIGELTDFTRRVRGEPVPAASGRDGLRALQIVQAVYESSAAGGQAQALPPL